MEKTHRNPPSPKQARCSSSQDILPCRKKPGADPLSSGRSSWRDVYLLEAQLAGPLWQRSQSFPPELGCQICFPGVQLAHREEKAEWGGAFAGPECDLLSVRREQITANPPASFFFFFSFFNWCFNERAAGSIIRACLSQVFSNGSDGSELRLFQERVAQREAPRVSA